MLKKAAFILISVLLIATLATPVLADMIFIEAESGVSPAGKEWVKESNGGALNGTAIYGEERDLEEITWEFEITEAGDYYAWFRSFGDNAENNDWFMLVDGKGFDGTAADPYVFDMYENPEGVYEYAANNPFLPSEAQRQDEEFLYGGWMWLPFGYRDVTVDPQTRHNILKMNFTAGKHSITMITREPEARLDKIIITNNLSYDPRGIAGDPEVPYLAELAAAQAAADAAAAEAAAANAAVDTPAPAATATAPAAKTGDAGMIAMAIFALSALMAFMAVKRKVRQ